MQNQRKCNLPNITFILKVISEKEILSEWAYLVRSKNVDFKKNIIIQSYRSHNTLKVK